MTVVCADRDGAAVDAVVAAITEAGGRAVAVTVDISDEQSVEACFQTARDAVGQLHALVNSAGVQGPLGVRSHEVDLAAFDATYAVNLRGAFLLSRAALQHMLAFQYGRIVHIASIAGKEGNPNMVSYSATKAGLIGMVKSQGKEYAEDGITINAIAPAVIQTPFLDTQPAEVIEYMTARIPMRRTGTVDEVAYLVSFIISPECSFTTGFTFDLSGGRATY